MFTAPVLRVALPLPLPRLFDYLTPAQQPDSPLTSEVIGRRVRVPFATRDLTGVVVDVVPAATTALELRAAHAYLDDVPVFHGELFDSLTWLARYTHAALGEVLATALPATLRRGEPLPDTQIWAWRLTTAQLPPRLRGKPAELAAVLHPQAQTEATLETTLKGWRVAARALLKRGLVERIPLSVSQAINPSPAPLLNEEQRSATQAIHAQNGFAAMLLDGVTGSGKTEVYLQAIADCLARGLQALVLVPEIGLTPQMLSRFSTRLGVQVHALHSGLNDSERARSWAAAWRGEAQLIVGTRSAVFTPLPHAGLIVIDEEHDTSYKQQDGIRYHARDFALLRGKTLGVPVVLGSATPSLESLHNAQAGRYMHLRLRHRAGVAQPPHVRVVDVRKRSLEAGLSTEALAAIERAISAGGQVLVFKNRRGYAPVLLCHDCGWSAYCKRCSTATRHQAMTVHASGRRLQCHHCGARQPVPLACPDCASLALRAQGAGTERIEALLGTRFTQVPVLRIDRGSTRRKHALQQHFATLGSSPGILVGTQLLAKGHDLAKLTLVVVATIDPGLYSSDFRAGEKTAQLLIQVAGRAGRADQPGEVLLQTHHPEHPLLQLLLSGGYAAFAEAELAQRHAAGFPPFTHLALLRAEAKQIAAPTAFLQATKALLLQEVDQIANGQHRSPMMPTRSADQAPAILELHGPVAAPMPKRAGMHRAQLLLSATQRRTLHATLDAVLPAMHALPEARKTRWSLDIDPIELT